MVKDQDGEAAAVGRGWDMGRGPARPALPTLAEEFEERALGPIRYAVIGEVGGSPDIASYAATRPGAGDDRRWEPALAARGRLMTWAEARPLLDVPVDRSFADPDAPAVHAWTDTQVLAVMEYDDLTWVQALPRHPVAGTPAMPGGGTARPFQDLAASTSGVDDDAHVVVLQEHQSGGGGGDAGS